MTDNNLLSRFKELRTKAERQLQIIDAAVAARLTAEGLTGGARESAEEQYRDEGITGCVWCNENYEGRAAAPEIPFRQIWNVVHELAPVFAHAQLISPAQRLGLEFAFLAADIREPF